MYDKTLPPTEKPLPPTGTMPLDKRLGQSISALMEAATQVTSLAGSLCGYEDSDQPDETATVPRADTGFLGDVDFASSEALRIADSILRDVERIRLRLGGR